MSAVDETLAALLRAVDDAEGDSDYVERLALDLLEAAREDERELIARWHDEEVVEYLAARAAVSRYDWEYANLTGAADAHEESARTIRAHEACPLKRKGEK